LHRHLVLHVFRAVRSSFRQQGPAASQSVSQVAFLCAASFNSVQFTRPRVRKRI
jgi:hypothetical protein